MQSVRRAWAMAWMESLPSTFSPRALAMIDRASPFVRLAVWGEMGTVFPLLHRRPQSRLEAPWRLSAAWRAVVEMMLGVDCVVVEPLVFALPDGREVEITDEWADVWCFLLRGPFVDDVRSEADTIGSDDDGLFGVG